MKNSLCRKTPLTLGCLQKWPAHRSACPSLTRNVRCVCFYAWCLVSLIVLRRTSALEPRRKRKECKCGWRSGLLNCSFCSSRRDQIPGGGRGCRQSIRLLGALILLFYHQSLMNSRGHVCVSSVWQRLAQNLVSVCLAVFPTGAQGPWWQDFASLVHPPVLLAFHMVSAK